MIDWSKLAPFAVTALLAIGVSLKIARYAVIGVPIETAAIERFMRAHDWTPTGPKRERAGQLYEWLEFSHPDCRIPIAIGFLGNAIDSIDLFRRDHGDDAVVLQDAELRRQPSSFKRQVAELRYVMGRLMGASARPGLPVVGISPAPRLATPNSDDRQVCQGPSAQAWTTPG